MPIIHTTTFRENSCGLTQGAHAATRWGDPKVLLREGNFAAKAASQSMAIAALRHSGGGAATGGLCSAGRLQPLAAGKAGTVRPEEGSSPQTRVGLADRLR